MSSPAQAQTIIDNQNHTSNDTRHRTFSSKQTATILTVIANPIPSFAQQSHSATATPSLQIS